MNPWISVVYGGRNPAQPDVFPPVLVNYSHVGLISNKVVLMLDQERSKAADRCSEELMLGELVHRHTGFQKR